MDAKDLESLIEKEGLDAAFIGKVDRYYRPLAAALAARSPLCVGVQGTQGSGKSTLALFLQFLLEREHGLKVAIASLDDFYLTRAQRQWLAETEHPLLATRGVPGTHDVALAQKCISAVKAGEACMIPRFNKALDDRVDVRDWSAIPAGIDIVLFEGWCVGARPEAPEALFSPINDLEKLEDHSGHWRRWVNERLAAEYQSLFSLLDCLVVLQAPSFDCVKDWRWLQEKKLIAKLQNEGQSRTLDERSLLRFISHYERLTRHCLATLPEHADYLLELDASHNIVSSRTKP